MEPGTAMLLSSAIGAGSGLLSSAFGRKKQKSVGPQVVTLPQYSFTEPRLRLTSDFVSENLQRLSAGKYPAYYAAAMPTIRKGLRRGLRETFYGGEGLEGGPGIIGEARAVGAATGAGPKATVSQVNKALATYATKEREIDEYLTKIGVDLASQTQGQMLQASLGLPKGPDARIIGGYALPAEKNYAMDAAMNMAKALPYFFAGSGGGTTPTEGTGMVDMEDLTGTYGPENFGSNLYDYPTYDYSSLYPTTTGPTVTDVDAPVSSSIGSGSKFIPGSREIFNAGPYVNTAIDYYAPKFRSGAEYISRFLQD